MRSHRPFEYTRSRVLMLRQFSDKLKPITGGPIVWKQPLTHRSPCFFIGSCFSQVIARKLQNLKFPALSNPAGIMFDPISIANCLSKVVTDHCYTESDVFVDLLQPDVYHSWMHHSCFSSTDRTEMLRAMTRSAEAARHHLINADTLFITLGTATVHRLRENGSVVANCHKQPSALFDQQNLTVEEVTSALESAIWLCKSVNPNLRVVLTVSPVRHLRIGQERQRQSIRSACSTNSADRNDRISAGIPREGAVNNSLSKSTLICAVHDLCGRDGLSSFMSYFPAYEIVMDELRDYRYYDEDMVHLTPVAENIIFDRFVARYIDEQTRRDYIPLVESARLSMAHTPLLPKSQAHRKHLQRTLNSLQSLSERHPEISFDEEIRIVRSNIDELSSNIIKTT